jgi:hypothetical protein
MLPLHDLPLRWWNRWRRGRPTADSNPDVAVAAWKTAWLEGAHAAWATQRVYSNPYAQGAERSAWDAGWRWAAHNPDRRDRHNNSRLAHPHRRASDSALCPSLKRAAAVGATGVTIFAISRLIRRLSRGSARES